MEIIFYYIVGYVFGFALFMLFTRVVNTKKACKKYKKSIKKASLKSFVLLNENKVMMDDEYSRYKNR